MANMKDFEKQRMVWRVLEKTTEAEPMSWRKFVDLFTRAIGQNPDFVQNDALASFVRGVDNVRLNYDMDRSLTVPTKIWLSEPHA